MKRLTLLILIALPSLYFSPKYRYLKTREHLTIRINPNTATPQLDRARTRNKAKQALLFCRSHQYNTRYCILIDMSLHSGLKRFVVWDFKGDSIKLAGLVSHGCGRNPWSWTNSREHVTFSNEDGSHCTAEGKYCIEQRAYSAWGINVKYFLKGLDKTNSNALKREIVFHSWEKVTDAEVYPIGTPEGWGCPAIANSTMKVVDAMLTKSANKHWLMWIYN